MDNSSQHFYSTYHVSSIKVLYIHFLTEIYNFSTISSISPTSASGNHQSVHCISEAFSPQIREIIWYFIFF